MGDTWHELSKQISHAVAQAGKSIVAVDGRSGHTSSGIIWRSDLVLTAAHTIRNDTSIRIVLGPEQSVQAQLVGRDRGADIALLKLEKDVGAQPAELGSTASLAVGDLTVAVARTRRGNIVASAGIISGLMGEWQVARTRVDQFIRPDINLYPGFSGGALLGADSKVLGLNTGGLLRGKPITIPSSTVTRIAEEIVVSGHVSRPYVGLVMQPVEIPDSLQQKAGTQSKAGLLVMHVESGGPAELGGALLGDILLDMDGQTFEDLDDIHQELSRKGAGKEVLTTLIRGGQKLQITIRIGSRPLR